MNYSKELLIEQLEAGKRVNYMLFWGAAVTESITRSCFSQWYPSPFEVDGIQYKTAEHWMMAEKARLFGDEAILAKILNSEKPVETKKLGRLINGFNQQVWDENKYSIVVKGNVYKFSQNEPLKAFLLGTGELVLVEASPVDRT